MISRFATTLLIFVSASQAPLLGQEFSLSVLSANGGTDANALLSLEWTLGELAIESFHDEHQGFTEGFHQPVVVDFTGEPNDLFTGIPFDTPTEKGFFSFYPNPVNTLLTIELSAPQHPELYLQIFELGGTIVDHRAMKSTENKTAMDFYNLPSGLYFLRITDSNGRTVTTQKISRI